MAIPPFLATMIVPIRSGRRARVAPRLALAGTFR
jgi:hypothetical protein